MYKRIHIHCSMIFFFNMKKKNYSSKFHWRSPHSIEYDNVRFQTWVPVFELHNLNFFGRFLPHAFNNADQLFHQTSLAQANSNGMECCHIGIQITIILKVVLHQDYILNDNMHEKNCVNLSIKETTYIKEQTKWCLRKREKNSYSHNIKNTKSFTWTSPLTKNCQKLCIHISAKPKRKKKCRNLSLLLPQSTIIYILIHP